MSTLRAGQLQAFALLFYSLPLFSLRLSLLFAVLTLF